MARPTAADIARVAGLAIGVHWRLDRLAATLADLRWMEVHRGEWANPTGGVDAYLRAQEERAADSLQELGDGLTAAWEWYTTRGVAGVWVADAADPAAPLASNAFESLMWHAVRFSAYVEAGASEPADPTGTVGMGEDDERPIRNYDIAALFAMKHCPYPLPVLTLVAAVRREAERAMRRPAGRPAIPSEPRLWYGMRSSAWDEANAHLPKWWADEEAPGRLARLVADARADPTLASGRRPSPDILHPLQRKILDALDGRALRQSGLVEATHTDPSQLHRSNGLKGLRDTGQVLHHPAIGFYRPDAPPPGVSPESHRGVTD